MGNCCAFLYPPQQPKGPATCHLEPAPPKSLCLLGYVALQVPDLGPAWNFYVDGLECGVSLSQQEGEIRGNVGPSQFRLTVAPDGVASHWPGQFRIWVADIRVPLDKFNMLGNTIGRATVDEILPSLHGGELSFKVHDPCRASSVFITECPAKFLQALRDIPCDASERDTAYPAKKASALAIFDVILNVPSTDMMNAAMKFYNFFLLADRPLPGPEDREVMLHFGPAPPLHQTLTFRLEEGVVFKKLGHICIYVQTKQKFHLCYARAKNAGLIVGTADWKIVQEQGEYRIRCVFDPDTKRDAIPLPHIIRSPCHPEFPLHSHSDTPPIVQAKDD